MTSAEEALKFVGRVQRGIAELAQSRPEFGGPSLSIGIAESPLHGSNADAILAAADAALYRAKRGGRNTVETADPT